MGAFILRRLLEGFVALLFLSVVVFLTSRLLGDPLNLLIPLEAPPEVRAEWSQRLGLDRPLPVQYARFVGNALRGDLGDSIKHGIGVLELFGERFPNSLRLVAPSFVVALAVGIPLGVVSASTKNKFVSQGIKLLSTIGMATPVFWVGILLVLVFSVQLGWLPAGRTGSIRYYVLPVLTLAFFLLASLVRLVDSSMREELGKEYVKFARLQGAPQTLLVWKHALRNSLISTASFVGVYFSVLITGSVVIEQVFAWPGAGRLMYEAVLGRDYPVVQGVILLSAAFIVVINLVVDIAHAYLDPRIRR